jgi:D-sedoheptulose 7-phosphate isomerase
VSAVGSEPTAFLYPFIDTEERDVHPLVQHLASSARAKIAASRELRSATVHDRRETIVAAASAVAARIVHGGRVLAFGNGGSSTDADALVAQLTSAAPDGSPGLPALSLADDPAILTALANDVGYDLVFTRQLAGIGRTADVAVGISTSGGSRNVLAALAEARRRGMLTIATCGYDGGEIARSADVDHCIVVASDSVHRIQEVQAVVLHAIAEQARALVREDRVRRLLR